MIRFDIITIFPSIFDSYFNESIIKRAREKKLINIKIHDLRKFTKDKHLKVDDKPFGGGPGMVLKIEPLTKALEMILQLRRPTSKSKKTSDVLIILLSVTGKQFDSKMAMQFVKKYDHVVMICGHYEGVDERIKKVIHDLPRLPDGQGFKFYELSVGPYVLTGGELPAMTIVDSISRQILGVLGKSDSIEENRYGVGVPAYTRPEIFHFKNKKYAVPKVLLSGNHKKIEDWRITHKKK